MDSLYTALSLSFITRKRIAITTSDTDAVISALKPLFNINNLISTEFNVKDHFDENNDIKDIAPNKGTLVFWRDVDFLSESHQKQLVQLLNRIDQFDTNASKIQRNKNREKGKERETEREGEKGFAKRKITINEIENENEKSSLKEKVVDWSSDIFDNEPMIVLLITEPNNIIQSLKLKFWFSQVCWAFEENWEPPQNWLEELIDLKKKQVFVSPDVQKYIYSLVVHTRNHRLCSISPMSSRLPTSSIRDIEILSKMIVVWSNSEKSKKLFVTPDSCKVAMRKIGYWLINWLVQENTRLPGESKTAYEQRKAVEYNSLSGDWYGCDWNMVDQYINKCKEKDKLEYNSIVEDALKSVAPPI